MENQETSQVSPPYIPLMTLDNFAGKLKATVLPPVIDPSLTKNLSGGTTNALMSALRFLGLIEQGGKVLPPLKALVEAHGGESYPTILGHVIDKAYANIIGDLNLTTATPAMLEAQFRDRGKVNGQVLEKAVRFYLGALERMKRPISPHFKLRKIRLTNSRKVRTKADTSKDHSDIDDADSDDLSIPEGMQRLELPLIGKANVILALPVDFDSNDWEFLEPILKKYVHRLLGLDLLK
jgi:hypothetical protein